MLESNIECASRRLKDHQGASQILSFAELPFMATDRRTLIAHTRQIRREVFISGKHDLGRKGLPLFDCNSAVRALNSRGVNANPHAVRPFLEASERASAHSMNMGAQ
jgi:hypothetical protein